MLFVLLHLTKYQCVRFCISYSLFNASACWLFNSCCLQSHINADPFGNASKISPLQEQVGPGVPHMFCSVVNRLWLIVICAFLYSSNKHTYWLNRSKDVQC